MQSKRGAPCNPRPGRGSLLAAIGECYGAWGAGGTRISEYAMVLISIIYIFMIKRGENGLGRWEQPWAVQGKHCDLCVSVYVCAYVGLAPQIRCMGRSSDCTLKERSEGFGAI